MNDVERKVREILVDEASRAPVVGHMPDRVRPRVRRRQAATVAVAALASLAVVAGVAIVMRSPGSVDKPADSTPPPAPSLSAAPLPVEGEIVHGWPGARSNPAGRYSWNVRGSSWMHNPKDESLGVSVTFSALASAYESGPTAVTVAGYDGTYQELPTSTDGIRTELWIVHIEEVRVTFTVEAQPGTTEAELAEARAIIGSIRSEPTENGAGFRLTFTLPKGWDSG